MTEQVKKVFKAISAVSEELLSGIEKNDINQQQRFKFRGIDSVYNALAPALVKNKLIIAPRIIEREVSERTSRNGGVLFYVTVKAEFDFISTEDGSIHTVTNYGEAMDSGDKATNKAMSIAYKYAAFQTFCIPTEDTSIDPELESHNVIKDDLRSVLVAQLDQQASLGYNAFKVKWESLSADEQQIVGSSYFNPKLAEVRKAEAQRAGN